MPDLIRIALGSGIEPSELFNLLEFEEATHDDWALRLLPSSTADVGGMSAARSCPFLSALTPHRRPR